MIEKLFAREFHAPLKFLGGREWVKYEVVGEKTVAKLQNISISADDLRRFTYEDLELAKTIVNTYCEGDSSTTMFVMSVAKALHDGPKLFCPTTDQCLALENTEANIGFDFYKQPYPTTIIELPKEYRQHLKEEFKCEVPLYVLIHQHSNGMLCISAFISRENVIVNTILPKYKTIEEGIATHHNPNGAEFSVAEASQRLGINFSLMMTMLGVKIVGPLDQESFKRNQRHLRSGDEKKAARAKKFLESTVYLCEFAQSINFFDVSHGTRTGGGGGSTPGQEHRSPKPHWRRGHFRQQAYGEGGLLRKLVFIKPLMVMAKYFAGDKSDTTVTYKAKGAKEPNV